MERKRQIAYENDDEEDIATPRHMPRKDNTRKKEEERGEDIRLPPSDPHVRQDVDW